MPPGVQLDTSSDLSGDWDSLIDHKLSEGCLKLVEDRVRYLFSIHDHQALSRSVASVRDPFFKTENFFLTGRVGGLKDFTDVLLKSKPSASETYNELRTLNNDLIVFLLADLKDVALVELNLVDDVIEGWTSFFEDMFDRPSATAVKRTETTLVGPGEATEETREEKLDRPSETLPAELTGILDDLREATDEAREEGFPVPSDTAIANSERLIKEVYGILPGRHGVYPTPDGEIAIDVFNGKGSSVVLLCDSAGGALCLVNMDGNHRRARYSKTDALPDGFVREALSELEL